MFLLPKTNTVSMQGQTYPRVKQYLDWIKIEEFYYVDWLMARAFFLSFFGSQTMKRYRSSSARSRMIFPPLAIVSFMNDMLSSARAKHYG